MARYSKEVEQAFRDVSLGDYYVDSDGHWLTLKEGWSYMGGRIVHENTARDMLAAKDSVTTEGSHAGT